METLISKLKSTCEKLLLEDRLPKPDVLEQGYRLFSEKFSADKLKALDGETLLNIMFHIGNKDGLFYWLEFKNDDELNTLNFGSIAGGSAFKYILYKRNIDGKWVTGNPQSPTVLSQEDAVILGRQIRDALVAGAFEIKSLEQSDNENRYEELAEKLNDVLAVESVNKNLSTFGWVHKYYHMIYPALIDDYHSNKWQKHGLISCGIAPKSDNYYVLAGQYQKLISECGFPISYITTAIYELFGGPINYYRIGTTDGKNSYWNDMRTGNYISIGWDKLGDLALSLQSEKPAMRAEIVSKLKESYPDYNAVTTGNMASQIVIFLNGMKESDIVIAAEGTKVFGIGRIIGDYEYIGGLNFPHTRKIEWQYFGETMLPESKEGIRSTVREIKKIENIMHIEALKNSSPLNLQTIQPQSKPLDEVCMQIESILSRKKQVILYGPPGTGKTYYAEKAARELAKRNGGVVRVCCFHPSYGYEDFIEGIKPSVKNNQTVFMLEDGIFKQLCLDAKNEPDKQFYLIIDEINRGDISRIFGELIMLIESNKRGKELILPLSKDTFFVPQNVFIIGTMNTADRNIALLDVALRRRFGFIELMPQYDFFTGVEFSGLPLGGWLRELNKRICEHIGKDARNLQIGHSYFLDNGKAVTDDLKFKKIVREDILPLIEEYCYGDYPLMSKILGTIIVDVNKQTVNYDLFATSDISELATALLAEAPELRTATEYTSDETEVPVENEDDE